MKIRLKINDLVEFKDIYTGENIFKVIKEIATVRKKVDGKLKTTKIIILKEKGALRETSIREEEIISVYRKVK